MPFFKHSISSAVFLATLATPVVSMAINCPPGTPIQTSSVRGADLIISDSRDGLHCHAAKVLVNFLNPSNKTVGSAFEAEIDTGSDVTIAGPEVVAGLNLAPAGPEVVLQAGVQGTQTKVMPYIAEVQLITGRQVPVQLLVRQGVTTLILGRDFLKNFTLIYEGRSGRVTLE